MTDFFPQCKLKASADDKNKCNLKKEIIFGMGRQTLREKEKNAGYSIFLLFP